MMACWCQHIWFRLAFVFKVEAFSKYPAGFNYIQLLKTAWAGKTAMADPLTGLLQKKKQTVRISKECLEDQDQTKPDRRQAVVVPQSNHLIVMTVTCFSLTDWQTGKRPPIISYHWIRVYITSKYTFNKHSIIFITCSIYVHSIIFITCIIFITYMYTYLW